MYQKENLPDKSDCSSPLSSKEAQIIAERLKALAHPARLQILQYLGMRKYCCCNDFCASIPLAQSTISQHLKILSTAGIIDYKPAGNCSHYSLNPDALGEVMSALRLVRRLADNVTTPIRQGREVL